MDYKFKMAAATRRSIALSVFSNIYLEYDHLNENSVGMCTKMKFEMAAITGNSLLYDHIGK